MAFSSIADFFAMGGYGFYVWLAYGISLLSLAILIINTVVKRKQILNNVNKRVARGQRIRQAKNMEGTL
ncbi:MAG: heme exporter protein CcmD [Psychromonas sp.]